MPDYTQLTEAQLEEERLALLTELDRRRDLARIPADIKALAEQFTAAGGDPGELSLGLEGAS
ncbi:hypothetical protein [Kocuria rhizophila]|uniref:hypothetical protein n=1 Tax=Kocuria rhizophila TaxID=72000 RepID=UPI0021A5C0E2|nr:hypothetical protein [Kocuria rhizophila]MCT2249364.1 hypothetical protein [Kocuria rhizophila]